MPHNQVGARLHDDGVVLGARSSSFAPIVIDAYGDLDLDFVWLDLEHAGPSPYDARALSELVRVANANDIELLVRPPEADPPLVHKVLDAGVQTLLIPRIKTAAEVREAVRATQFTYDNAPGDRGYGGPPPGWNHPDEEFTERADDGMVVGAMIEHERAVEAIHEILEVPELDFVFVGANDLSISMGYPGEPDHPDVQAAIETVEAAADSAAMPLGAPMHDTAAAATAIEQGYRLLRIGDEIGAIKASLGDRLAALRK